MYQNSITDKIHYANDEAGTGANTPADANNNEDSGKDINALLEGVDLDALLQNEAVQKKVQSIADARVTQALATAKAKWDADAQEAQTEAGKLAKMTAAERDKYQLAKDKQAFEAEKAKFKRQQLQVETAKQLLEAGLPDLSAYITADTAEDTKANIENLTTLLGNWKADEVKKAMRGNPPADTNPGKNDAGEVTKEQFDRMSYSDRLKLYNSRPELYKKLNQK